MTEKNRTFLTLTQAVDAVAADFGQYGVQPDLFYQIGLLVMGTNFKLGLLNGVKRAWIRPDKNLPFTLAGDEGLGFYLIHLLGTCQKDARTMARICALVFQADARPGQLGDNFGIWIENHMGGFVCKRCAYCCHRLETVCVEPDFLLWQSLGRRDILSWVKEERLETGKIQYRIWVNPNTGKIAESCPFLAFEKTNGRSYCRIQAVKPRVCKEYPFTRKHALHTGCPGFDG
ncbi:MAG: YkgJ family cysteine cluster protein [Desulfobacter sp.]|nr:MAG: YkgJ family cysteine cluster protein [Desulfobacter sp.]